MVAATDSKAHQGSELIPPELQDRQEMAHCHCILPNPSHPKWVAVCDLGLSAVFIYELDTVHGALHGAYDDPRHLRLDAGAGCRHCIWSADGNTLFVNNGTHASHPQLSGYLSSKIEQNMISY